MYRKRNGSQYFQKKSRNQVNKRISNIEEGPCPDYPPIIDRDGRKEREIVIRDFCHGETIEHVFTLYGSNDINCDQYLVFADGEQLFMNRRNKVVKNQTRKPFAIGWTGAGNFAISQFVRVRRFDG